MNNLIYALKIEKIDMFDKSRKRNIPVVIYQGEGAKNKQLVIINHGYGFRNTEYSFIANSLASQGYFVASIQHDLETDKRPKTGTLFARRMPFWERSVQNILFVIDELKNMESTKLDLNKVILIGHSDGGDASMMFATLYPNKVSKIISLDSRRYPFPRNTDIEILRFGASDDEPDEGVVPNSGVRVIYVKDAKHNDLCDMGSPDIKDEIQKSIIWFLVR